MSLFILPQEAFYGGLSEMNKRTKVAYQCLISYNCQTKAGNSQSKDEEKFHIMKEKNLQAAFQGSLGLEIELTQKIKGVFFVKSLRNGSVFQLKMDLLGPQQLYYKIQSNHKVPQICRNLSIHQAKAGKPHLRMAVNSETRQVRITLSSIMISNRHRLQQSSSIISTQLSKMAFNVIQANLNHINQLIRWILKPQDNLQQKPISQTTFSKQLATVLKYYEISTLSTQVKNHLISQTFKLNPQKRANTLFQLATKQPIGPILAKSFSLFSAGFELSEKNYSFGKKQLELIEEMIAMPTEIRRNSNVDNLQVVNYIYIKNPKRIEKVKINEGGFADIYQAELKFWNIDLIKCKDDKQMLEHQYLEETLLEKVVVIKEQLMPKTCYVNQVKQQQSRVIHEFKILQKMATAKAIFTPKYYIPLNRPNPFTNCLLMDHLPSLTLTQFLKAYHLSLSLQSKLCFMFAIVQAVRFIREFEIVHLDLKPSNIVIFHHWVIKLIDFGESYHPGVCGQNFIPGYTIPYTCPELFSNIKTFTHLSDVYSVGVIFYQMLYGKTPFLLNTNTTLIDREMQRYHELWYFSHEEYESYGDSSVLRVLNLVISKCMARQPQQRPELDWIAVILRHLIEVIRL